MIVVHGTAELRRRVPGPAPGPGEGSTTWLGPWYATVLRWRRPAALVVNEATLLPVVVALAPAKTLLARLPDAIADVLGAHHVPADLVEAERAAMATVALAPTANRSVVGVMTELAYLAGPSPSGTPGPAELLALSLQLATAPLGPLYKRHLSPDRELAALVATRTG